MIGALTLLLVYQLVGEVAAQLLRLPIPGPVVGMLLLFVTLIFRGEASASLRTTANGLLRHLSLLFVPAGVGVMVHGDLIAAEWLPIIAALVGSTALTLVVTAWVLRALLARGKP
ncbi:MAG: CidA/LrgA family protein [Thiotrichales bacterium]